MLPFFLLPDATEDFVKGRGKEKSFMRKHYIKLTALLTSMTIMLSGCAGCAGCNGNDTPGTPTPAITVTTAPTKEPVQPTPTETPVAVTTAPTPTVEPTATPEPTNTPMPTLTMAVSEDATLLDSVKMGDDVRYDFYDDGTLVVRGTGKAKDFKGAIEMHTYLKEQCSLEQKSAFFGASTIVIDEGIVGIGKFALGNFVDATKIVFSSTLERLDENALYAMGYNSGRMEYINLDTDKVNIASTAFAYCGSPEKIPNSEKYTVTPTPTQAPTATPLPDPNKPRKYATKQMGANVTFEFWDNGYLYVKGTGATWDKEWNFCEFRNEPYCNTHSVVVEEGITRLGTGVFNFLGNVRYYEFPNSLKEVENGGVIVTTDKVTIKGFYKEKSIIIKTVGGFDSQTYFTVLEDVDKAINDGYEISFE